MKTETTREKLQKEIKFKYFSLNEIEEIDNEAVILNKLKNYKFKEKQKLNWNDYSYIISLLSKKERDYLNKNSKRFEIECENIRKQENYDVFRDKNSDKTFLKMIEYAIIIQAFDDVKKGVDLLPKYDDMLVLPKNNMAIRTFFDKNLDMFYILYDETNRRLKELQKKQAFCSMIEQNNFGKNKTREIIFGNIKERNEISNLQKLEYLTDVEYFNNTYDMMKQAINNGRSRKEINEDIEVEIIKDMGKEISNPYTLLNKLAIHNLFDGRAKNYMITEYAKIDMEYHKLKNRMNI